MNHYVDGFIIPIPKARLEEYRVMAEKAAKIWKEYGALDYWECVGDDMATQDTLSFPQIANVTADEVVIFSWIVYESKEARDAVNAKVFADPRCNEMMDEANPIFDTKRMACGGFRPLVHA